MTHYPNEIIQLDITDMPNISTTSSYYKYWCAFDVFTKVVCILPTKNKNSACVNTAKTIINKFKPDIIESVQGSEFFIKDFKNIL